MEYAIRIGLIFIYFFQIAIFQQDQPEIFAKASWNEPDFDESGIQRQLYSPTISQFTTIAKNVNLFYSLRNSDETYIKSKFAEDDIEILPKNESFRTFMQLIISGIEKLDNVVTPIDHLLMKNAIKDEDLTNSKWFPRNQTKPPSKHFANQNQFVIKVNKLLKDGMQKTRNLTEDNKTKENNQHLNNQEELLRKNIKKDKNLMKQESWVIVEKKQNQKPRRRLLKTTNLLIESHSSCCGNDENGDQKRDTITT